MIFGVKRTLVIVRTFDEQGVLEDVYRTTNFLTEGGEAEIAAIITAGTITHMAIGEGTGQTRASTTLATEVHRKALTSTTQGTAGDDNDITFVGDFNASEPATEKTITEVAMFDAGAGGTMVNYVELSPGRLKQTTKTLQVNIIWTVGAS